MIKDIQLIKVPTYLDDRGYLSVLYDHLQLPDIVYPKIDRVYFVGNFAKNTIRGFHKHKRNWDFFFITHGSAKIVLVDDRKDSLTYKEINTFILSDKQYSVLIVPPSIWHGFMSLEDDTQLINLASEGLDKSNPDEVRIPPDSYGDVWTVKGR